MFKIMNSRQSIFVILLVYLTITLIIYSLFGMLIVQYAYMASINGNAAVALLQYIAPVYISFYGLHSEVKKSYLI